MAEQRLSQTSFSKIYLLVFVLAFAYIGGYELLYSHATGPVANIFVAANGSDTATNCKRFTTATANPDTSGVSLCASFNKAYKLAQPGDLVSVLSGSYPYQPIYPDASKKISDGSCSITPTSQNLTSCITFLSYGSRPVVKGISVLSPGLRFKDIDVADAGFGVSWKDNPSGTSCKNSAQPHDIIFDNIHNYVTGGVPQPGKAPGANVGAVGVYNVAVLNSNLGPFYDGVGTAQFSNLTPAASTYCSAYPAAQLKDKSIYLFNNYWHDLYQTVVSNGPNCGSDPAQYECNHMECIHWRASNSWIINNKFTNCAQNDISVQTFGSNVPNIDNLQIIGNVFDRPCSNQSAPCGSISALPIICSSGTDTITNAIVAYNSIWGNAGFQKDSCTNPTPFAGSIVVGNLMRATSSSFSCSTKTAVGVVFAYNVWDSSSSAVCDPSDHILKATTFPWISPNSPSFNFALSNNSEAENFVPKQVTVSGKTVTCPSVDIAGVVRPKAGNSKCSAGAYESSFTATVTGNGASTVVSPPSSGSASKPATQPTTTAPKTSTTGAAEAGSSSAGQTEVSANNQTSVPTLHSTSAVTPSAVATLTANTTKKTNKPAVTAFSAVAVAALGTAGYLIKKIRGRWL